MFLGCVFKSYVCMSFQLEYFEFFPQRGGRGGEMVRH